MQRYYTIRINEEQRALLESFLEIAVDSGEADEETTLLWGMLRDLPTNPEADVHDFTM